MKRCSTRWRLRRSRALALCAAAGLAASACVTRGTHDQVVAERDSLRAQKRQLTERVEKLSATNESLGAERLRLLDEMEDLRQERERLDRDVRKLARAEAELSASLQQSEQALASRNSELERLRSTYDDLVSDLEAEVASGEIEIQRLREGLRLNMAQQVLFAPGSAEVNASGRAVLRKVAGRVKELPHRVEVQGHTDDVPVGATSDFASNWELAAARATRVVRLLAKEGVDPGQLRAISFGEFAPVASNDSPEGRARNRRIEIRLRPEPQDEAEPPGSLPAAPAPTANAGS